LCVFIDTEAVVVVSSAMSKNGVFYVTPAMTSDTAHLLSRINDIIRLYIANTRELMTSSGCIQQTHENWWHHQVVNSKHTRTDDIIRLCTANTQQLMTSSGCTQQTHMNWWHHQVVHSTYTTTDDIVRLYTANTQQLMTSSGCTQQIHKNWWHH